MSAALPSGDHGAARVRVLAMLALATLLAHLFLVDRLSAALEAGLGATPEPARLQAAFVRELQLQEAPPPPVRPADTPALRSRAATQPAAPEPPAPAASTTPPEVVEAPVPADMPAAVAEAVAPAASAPEPASPVVEAPAVAGVPASAAAPPFEWPLGTRLHYALTGNVRGEVLGQAQVEWLREGSRYQVHLDVVVGPSFAPAMQRRMTSDGELTDRGLAPRRYDERTQIAFTAAREATVTFEPDGPGEPGAVTLANGRRLPGLPGVQDTASQFVQLTWLFASGRQPLQAGARVELPVALPRRLDRWIYEVAGEEWLDTRAGRVRTWHLVPQKLADAVTLSFEAWFAPGLQYLPVRIVIRNGKDDFIDLVIDRLPQQAEEVPQEGSVGR